MDVTTLLRNYSGWVDTGDIQFLEKEAPRSEVKEHVDALWCIMNKLREKDELREKQEGKNPEKKQEQGEGQDWYEAHKKGRKLWEVLAKYALRDIEPTAKGNSTLYDFLDAETQFEDILYGLESHYRDHTLHSLWVYLIGEHILRNRIEDSVSDKSIYLREKLDWYLYNDITEDADKSSIPKVLANYSKIKKSILAKVVERHTDAMWCIMALCHDLGYSLEKLRDLNDKVKQVLKFFDISDLEHTGYSLDIEHQYLVSQCLELMAMDVRIVPGEDYSEITDKNYKLLNEKLKEFVDTKLEEDIVNTKLEEAVDKEIKKQITGASIKLDTTRIIKSAAGLKGKKELDQIRKLEEKTLVKCYRDDSTYWRLCRALEKKQHGILSSYLIFKILGIFADATVRGPAEEWGLDDDETVENIIRGDILFAIAQHEFDFTHIFEFSSLADVLVLADELEEFSRLGRPLQSREYLPTMATAEVGFNLNEGNIEINITYDVKEKHNLIDFFIRKAERLCSVYSLNERDEPKGRYRIQQIAMTAKKKIKPNNGGAGKTLKLTIEINKGPNSIARLPKYESSGTVPNSDTKDYPISLYDDKIRIKEKLLSEWFEMRKGKRKLSKEWEEEIGKYTQLQKQSKEKM